MSAVTRQARANLRNGRLQAGLVVVVVTAAAALLTVAFATLGATGGAYQRLVDRTAGADLWMELDAARVDGEVVREDLVALPGVTATTSPRPTLRGADLRLGADRATVHLREWVADTEPVGRLALIAGRAPAAADEVAVDVNVAGAHDLEVGDTLELLTPVGWSPVTLAALTASAEMCPYPTCQPTVVHLGVGGMAAHDLLSAPDLASTAFGVRIDGSTTTAAVLDEVEAMLPAGAVLMSHDLETIQELTEFLLQVQSVFLMAFGVMAAVAAGALIANAIGEAVRSQTRRIGLLKAVGFTRWQVARTYLVEQVGSAAVGAVVGLGIGVIVARAGLREVAGQYGEANLRLPWWILVAVPVIVLLVTVVFTVVPARRAARVDTMTAIRTGSAARPRRAARLARRLPVAVASGIADLRARPARTVVTTLTLGIAVLTLVFASGTLATLRWFDEDPAAGFRPAADLVVRRPAMLPDDQVRAALAGHPEITAVAADTWVPFRFPGGDEQLQIRAISDPATFEVGVLEGRRFAAPGEVVAGYALARDRGLRPGDATTLVIAGAEVDVEVVGIHREASNLGQLLMTDAATLAGVATDAQPLDYHLTLAPGADAGAVAVAVRSGTDGALSPTVVDGAGLGILDTMPGIMAGLSLVLVAVALFGVASTVWIGVQERRRDTGLLKAVGMTSRQVLGAVLTGVVVVALVAYLVALPVGLLATAGLVDLLARQLGFGPLMPRFDVTQLALILPAIALVALAAAAVPARRAGRIPVAQALRHE